MSQLIRRHASPFNRVTDAWNKANPGVQLDQGHINVIYQLLSSGYSTNQIVQRLEAIYFGD